MPVAFPLRIFYAVPIVYEGLFLGITYVAPPESRFDGIEIDEDDKRPLEDIMEEYSRVLVESDRIWARNVRRLHYEIPPRIQKVFWGEFGRRVGAATTEEAALDTMGAYLTLLFPLSLAVIQSKGSSETRVWWEYRDCAVGQEWQRASADEALPAWAATLNEAINGVPVWIGQVGQGGLRTLGESADYRAALYTEPKRAGEQRGDSAVNVAVPVGSRLLRVTLFFRDDPQMYPAGERKASTYLMARAQDVRSALQLIDAIVRSITGNSG